MRENKMPDVLRYRHIRKKKDGTICGHEWTPDSEKPVCCPKCKAYIDWANPSVDIEVLQENKK